MTTTESKEEKTRICSTTGCGKPGTMLCPTCIKLGLPKASFCSQECFKGFWKEHVSAHQEAKARASFKPPPFPYTGPLRPYYVSPMRSVPDHIQKPDYAETGIPESEKQAKRESNKIPIYTKEEIEGIRAACRIGREVLDIAARMVRPGVTTDQIDEAVHEATIARNAYPSPLNYYNFPKSCCTSVNEVICHGIPDARPLEEGDIINIDISVYYNGFHGDLNETYLVSDKVDEDSKRLIKATYDSLMASIFQARPGTMCRDFGDTITKVVGKQGFSVVRSYCGHGIGRLFHTVPNIPHYARNKAVGVLKPGMVFTIEPMINAGTYKDVLWDFDDWTATTADGKRSAQFEHTIVITEDGCEILTARTEESQRFHWETEDDFKALLASKGIVKNGAMAVPGSLPCSAPSDGAAATEKKSSKRKKKKKSAAAAAEAAPAEDEESQA